MRISWLVSTFGSGSESGSGNGSRWQEGTNKRDQSKIPVEMLSNNVYQICVYMYGYEVGEQEEEEKEKGRINDIESLLEILETNVYNIFFFSSLCCEWSVEQKRWRGRIATLTVGSG